DLEDLSDGGTRMLHNSLSRPSPKLLHFPNERLSLIDAVELQVDQYIIRILVRPKNLIAPNARAFPISRIAIEHLLPLREIRDRVLDSHNDHYCTLCYLGITPCNRSQCRCPDHPPDPPPLPSRAHSRPVTYSCVAREAL